MSLSVGARLGPYEIVSRLGAGGMGDVWHGRDTRLDRSVAIKVLHADFAKSAQLRLRFEREAKAISQLTHPHICTLYDVGHEDDVDFLVMEYLEGETLADRVVKGPLPFEQIVRYGIQIAEALAKAHKRGIVHRDVKPGNIMLTKSGAKLLDFGLAKPSENGVVEELTTVRTEKKSLTEEGTIVGTFQYMAPEQVEGHVVDARSDIFAFGAVLYEMATGRRAFEGKTKASLIASILTTQPPPINAIQPMTPASLDRVVRSCLAKDPDERWQSAHDIALELRQVAEPQPLAKSRRHALPWAIAALFLLATIGTGIALWRTQSATAGGDPIRTCILPPENTVFDFRFFGAPPAISPDGKRVVFGATEPGKKRMLSIRSLDSLVAQQLPGTEDAMFPFWSPDGRSVAFFTNEALRKIEPGGGAPVSLCNVAEGRGGSWSPDGQTIIFCGRNTPIMRVPAAGGSPVEITALDGAFSSHRWPEFLPDSRHFLFLASPAGTEDVLNTICVGSIDTRMRKALVSRADDPHYWNGTLLFVRDQVLTAQRFDPKRLELSGDVVQLKEQPIETTTFAKSIVSIAGDGTLLYQTGSQPRETQLTWFDRSGKEIGKIGEPARYGMPKLDADGRQVAAFIGAFPNGNIWTFDLTRGVKSRVTFGSGFDFSPLWSPDGRKLAYMSTEKSGFRLLLKDLTNGGEEELFKGGGQGNSAVTSWSADGRLILFNFGATTRSDIWWMSLDERKPHLYLGTPFVETAARFSPDGKWVAYQSNESGNPEIYIAPFPPTGAKWQVSSGRGASPRWRGDGQELFYVTPTVTVMFMAVPIRLGATPEIGQAAKLFSVPINNPNSGVYDVTRDGQRFLVNARMGEEPPPQPLILLQHFDRELAEALKLKEDH